MTLGRIYLHELIGRLVHDESGAPVGRIFEIRAEETDGALQIVEFHIGTAAALQRLGLSLMTAIGIDRAQPQIIPWDKLDLSDIERPVLRS
jgi:hypothetical protein